MRHCSWGKHGDISSFETVRHGLDKDICTIQYIQLLCNLLLQSRVEFSKVAIQLECGFLIQAVFYHENKFWTIKRPLAFISEARKGQIGHNINSVSFGKKIFLAYFGLAAFMAFKGQKGWPFPA